MATCSEGSEPTIQNINIDEMTTALANITSNILSQLTYLMIQLSSRSMRLQKVSALKQMLERTERNVTHCGEHEEFTLLQHEIYQTYKMEKRNMLGRIYDLFPDSMPDTDMRKKRGLADFIGHSLHVLA